MQPQVPFEKDMQLGMGYDPQTAQTCAIGVTGEEKTLEKGEYVVYKLLVVESREALCRALAIDASLAVSGFGCSGSAEVSIAQNQDISQSEVMLLVIVQVSLPARLLTNRTLADNAAKLVNDPEKFKQYCGTQ